MDLKRLDLQEFKHYATVGEFDNVTFSGEDIRHLLKLLASCGEEEYRKGYAEGCADTHDSYESSFWEDVLNE